MENKIMREIYTEYLDNLTFRIRHNRTLNDIEKQIIQQLILNESIKISKLNEMEKLEKMSEEIREVIEELEKEG
jgi:hypothetical protein|nr:MAG TPA: hypothetical protein [Caudoviricetes sp.]